MSRHLEQQHGATGASTKLKPPPYALGVDTSSYVQVPCVAASYCAYFTHVAWMYVNSLPVANTQIMGQYAGSYEIHLTTTGAIRIRLYNTYVTSDVVVPLKRWFHLAVTFTGNTQLANIYINGVLAGTANMGRAGNGNVSSTLARFGSFDGEMAGCGAYNYAGVAGAITASQALDIFRANTQNANTFLIDGGDWPSAAPATGTQAWKSILRMDSELPLTNYGSGGGATTSTGSPSIIAH